MTNKEEIPKEDIPICTGGLRILMIKDKKERRRKWDKLIKSAYKNTKYDKTKGDNNDNNKCA